MSVKAVEVKNTSDHPVTFSTEAGLVTLTPGQFVRNVRLEESTLQEHTELKTRLQLHD